MKTENIKNFKAIFIIDIPQCFIDEEVIITGIIIKKRKFEKNKTGVWIRDITGTLLIIIDNILDPISYKWDPKSVLVDTRIRIEGQIAENSSKTRILNNISNIEILGTPTTELSELDTEIREQASRMLMSRICRKASDTLQINNFTEFESRVVSKHWNEDSLEPLLVTYPGFGSPAVLITSPASQVVEFLTTTLLSRAFTVSTSFTSSYRFPNGSAETRVIVAKALDMDMEKQLQLLWDVAKKVLAQFDKELTSFITLSGVWPDKIEGFGDDISQLNHELNLINFSANIPVIGKKWNTRINTIIQLLDIDKNILAEGARELLGDDIVISSFTIYPSQFLGLIEKAPRRQLQNLMKLYEGTKL